MSTKQIDVTCPCCSARLSVDVSTAKVMRTVRAEDQKEGAPPKDHWGSAQERVRERTKTSADKLESALENERGKAQRFDELFKKATDKHSPKKEEDDA